MGKWAGPMEVRARSCAVLAAPADGRKAAHGVELAEKKRQKVQPCHAPARLGEQESRVGDQGGGKAAGGHVRPEDKFGVAGDPPLERGARMIIRGRDLVQDLAARVIEAAISSPAQAEAQVDVLVIGSERGIEASDPTNCLGPVERARAAGGEDLVDRTSRPAFGRLAVPALGRPAAQRVGSRRPSRLDRGRSGPEPAVPPNPTVGSAKGARPASSQPCVTSVSLLSNWMK